MPDIWYDVDTALAEVPVNILPLLDDTDFKSVEGAVAYNAAGLALRWHFVTCAGAYTVTSVTPTTGGDYDWTDQGDSGIYTIEIPASGGASINNDTEGFGWFTGVATGILPWRGPVIGFRAAALNDALIENAWSTTRGLAGTALPAAAADAAGGLPISDAGGLDLDAILADTNELQTDWANGGRLDLLVDAILADTGTDGVVVAAASKTGYALSATGLDLVVKLKALLDGTPSGSVVDDNDPDPTDTAFETDLSEATNDHYNGAFVVFYSGALAGQSRKISDYDGTTKVLAVAAAFTEAPAAGDDFLIIGRSE